MLNGLNVTRDQNTKMRPYKVDMYVPSLNCKTVCFAY